MFSIYRYTQLQKYQTLLNMNIILGLCNTDILYTELLQAQIPKVKREGKVTNIEYGNVDFEKVIIETVTSTRR